MTDRMQVKGHLRNGALYRPLPEPSLSGEWKRRLLYQHALHQQLKSALQERNRLPKWFLCVAIPIICVVLAFATYFGFILSEHWYERMAAILDYDYLQIGLNEAIAFIVIVNGLTLLNGLLQVGVQYFPGTARELGKELSVIHEIDSQPLGDAEYPLPVGNGFEHFGA